MLKYHYIDTLNSLDRACRTILSLEPLLIGLDTESTVRANGSVNSVGVLQLAVQGDHGGVILDGEYGNIQGTTTVWIVSMGTILREMKRTRGLLPQPLERLLVNHAIKKVGCNIRQDAMLLNRQLRLRTNGEIDLQQVAESIGIAGVSLDRLAQLLLGTNKIEIDLLAVNWDGTLSEHQLQYAIVDAALSLHCYLALFKPVAKPESSGEDGDETTIELWHYLRESSPFRGKRNPSVRTLENVTKAGFTRWRSSYPATVRVQLFQKHFAKMVAQKLLFHDPLMDEVALEPFGTRVRVELTLPSTVSRPDMERTTKLVRYLSLNPAGISQPSLVKLLVSGFVNDQPLAERETFATAFVERLLEARVVEMRGERICYIITPNEPEESIPEVPAEPEGGIDWAEPVHQTPERSEPNPLDQPNSAPEVQSVH